MAKNEAKIKFTAETGDFNASISKANSKMTELRAELRLNETQMKGTGESVEGLQKKHNILQAELEVTESKTKALSGKLEAAIRNFGEGSVEVDKYRTQLLNAQTAEEKLRQEIERLQRELDGLGGKEDEVEKETEDLTEGFTVMKGAMADLVADGIEAVVSGLGEIASSTTQLAVDSDKALNTLVTRTGAAESEVEELDEAMKSVYKNNFGESMEDVAEAMATVRTNTKVSNEELAKTTEQALLLRDTFDFDVNESTRSAKMLMDQFGMSSEEAFNLIVQGAQKGLNKNGDLLDTINEYSVHFKQMGYDAPTMFNMLVNGADSGTFSVDKLGDAMKEFGIRTKDSSDSTADAFATLRLTSEESGKTAEDFFKRFAAGGDEAQAATNEVLTALFAMEDKVAQDAAGVALFGTMWEDLGIEGIKALTSVNGEISTTNKALSEINERKYDDVGSAIEGVGRILSTSVSGVIEEDVLPSINDFISGIDWEDFGQTVGEVVGDVVEAFFSIAEGAQAAYKWMSEHKGVMIAIASVVGILTAAITAYNIVQGVKAAMEAANVTTVWALVGAHIAQAAAAMAAIAPYVLIVAAIAAVIAIIVLCVKYWDEIVAAVKKCWDKCMQTLKKWGSWINDNVIQPIVDFFTGLWDGIVSIFQSVIDWVKDNWKSIVLFIINPFAGVFNYLYENFEGFRNVVNNVVTAIKNFFIDLWNGVKQVWEWICNAIQTAVMFIGSIISAAFQIITLPFRLIWENCKEYVFAAWEWIKNAISTAINKVKSVISTVMNAIKTVFNTVWNAIKSVVSTVWDWIKNKVTTAVNAVKSVVSTVWNAIKSTTTTIFNAVKSVVSSVWNGVKNAVTTAVNAVKSVVTTVWNAIKSATTTAFNAVKSVVSNIWNGIKSTVSNVVNGVKSTVSNVWNGIKSTTSNVFNSIKSTVSRVWNGIKEAIMKPIEAAKTKIKGIVDSIKGFFSGMKISLPKIKLPHFKVEGKLSISPPSVPKLTIDWYKEGGIMVKPMIFGVNGTNLMGGGEAGPEAILPISKLEDYVVGAIEKTMNNNNMQGLVEVIEDLANRPLFFNVNGRTLAEATASDTDSVHGLRNSFKSRGLVLE